MEQFRSNALWGDWSLLSVDFFPSDGSDAFALFGNTPRGRLLLTESGRMMAYIEARDRSEQLGESASEALLRTMMAYTGRFTLDHDVLTIHVDGAWSPAWLGGDQVRSFSIVDNVLTLTSAEQTHPAFPEMVGRGVIRWHRDRPIST